MNMNLVCVPCGRKMHVKKVGVPFVEVVMWEEPTPYRLWHADAWVCPRCGYSILYTDERQTPIAEHYEDGFKELIAEVGLEAKDHNVP